MSCSSNPVAPTRRRKRLAWTKEEEAVLRVIILWMYIFIVETPSLALAFPRPSFKKRAYPVQRAPALCGVWGRVLVASLTLACAMHFWSQAVRLYRLHQARYCQ